MVVPGEDADASPGLPIPDPDGLVVRGGENPGVLVVEHSRADVVQVAQKSEQTTPQLVVPHLSRV